MNTVEITDILRNDEYSSIMFKGVFAKDEIKGHEFSPPAAFVLNTDPSTQEGEHWIACYFDGDVSEYYDSMGLAPRFNAFNTFMNRNSSAWIFNETTVQSPFSNACGHHCIFYILLRSRGYTMADIVGLFDENLDKNDTYVKNVIMYLTNGAK
jgi:hypothetical protein